MDKGWSSFTHETYLFTRYFLIFVYLYLFFMLVLFFTSFWCFYPYVYLICFFLILSWTNDVAESHLCWVGGKRYYLLIHISSDGLGLFFSKCGVMPWFCCCYDTGTVCILLNRVLWSVITPWSLIYCVFPEYQEVGGLM